MAATEDSPYSAMTVNERLFEAGLFDQFDRAAHAHDTKEVEALLAKVDLPPEGIRQVIDWLYTSPHSVYRGEKT
jgi:hypothetical protein